MSARSVAWLVNTVLAGAGLAAGCDFWSLGAYRAGAQVRVVGPDELRGGAFGAALATVPGPGALDDERLAVSSGLGSSIAVYDASTLRASDGAASRPAGYVCGPDAPCPDARAGAPLVGLARWGAGASCAAAALFGVARNTVRIACFAATPPTRVELAMPDGLTVEDGFGLALAAPAGPEGGLLFVGAPSAAGRVLVLRDTGAVSALEAPALPPGALFGGALAVARGRVSAAAPTEATTLTLAVGAPGASTVYVYRGDPARGVAMSPAGCVAGAGEPGFGGTLALGDFDGDGLTDVAVGASAEQRPRGEQLRVFFGAAAPAVVGARCDAGAWPGVALGCAPREGAGCEDAVFGGALAAADLDGDGRDELLVGAPGARVDGARAAGAVFVAQARGAPGAPTLAVASVLRAATADEDAALGVAVGSVRREGRREAVVGSRGRGAWVFACSGLAGDAPDAPGLDARCRPRAAMR